MSTIDIYQEAYNTLAEKKATFELELIKSADPKTKFSLKKDIEDCDKELMRLRTILEECTCDPFLDIPSKVNSQKLISKKIQESEITANKRLKGKIAAHLIIAVFLQSLSQNLVYIQPELYYQDPNSGDFCKKPVNQIGGLDSNDEKSFVINEFPSRLQSLVYTAFNQLEELKLASDQFWGLTINLFVPLELLSLPLIGWCGRASKLLQNYPIIFGCSDRYNSVLERSAELRNQLKRAWWERFQKNLPDESSRPLRELKWLISDESSQDSFEDCSGLQCFGNWLKPGEQHFGYWAKLIESGIPIALWMCEGRPIRSEISEIYKELTNCTRFAFLEQVCTVRRKQHKNCDYHLGVLYEDPKYAPTETKLFSWPGTA